METLLNDLDAVATYQVSLCYRKPLALIQRDRLHPELFHADDIIPCPNFTETTRRRFHGRKIGGAFLSNPWHEKIGEDRVVQCVHRDETPQTARQARAGEWLAEFLCKGNSKDISVATILRLRLRAKLTQRALLYS